MTIDELSARLWENRLARNPVAASIMGFHHLDTLLPDLSGPALDASASDLRSIAVDADAVDPETLSFTERITRSLIIHEAETSADAVEGRYLLGAIDNYVGPPSSLILAVSNLTAADQEMADAYLHRWAGLPESLEEALRLNEGELAKGRTPAAIVLHRVLDGIDGYLGSDLDTDPFLAATLPPGADDSFRDRVEDMVRNTVRPAYQTYRERLANLAEPVARPDDRPGMSHMRDGDEVYPKLVHLYTSLDADPEELHEYGVADATERLPEEWSAIGQSSLGISDPSTLFDHLRNAPGLSFESADEMVAHAEATVARAWEGIDGWFGARPETPCEVRPVPEAIAAGLPPAFYYAPSEDGSRPGTYFINTHDPASRKVFNYESIHFHEAIPGHHFDRSLSVELKDLPEFRRHFPSFAHAEGWGLYAERLADEMGLYSSDTDRLGMLTADAWRAGRLVVDTGMHAKGWSRQQAIDWMLEWTPLPLPVITQEIDRYIGMAGQALAYKVGQREIFRLRRRAQESLDKAFTIAGFHDAVLTSGGLTLPVLGDVVERWIEASQPS